MLVVVTHGERWVSFVVRALCPSRKANAQDSVTGRFWQRRFKVQALLTEKALLTAMTYVVLHPVHANIATGISKSH